MIDQSKFKQVSIGELENPSTHGNYDLYLGYWWCIDADGMCLFYDKSPQCNKSEYVARTFAVSKSWSPAVDITFIERAWVPS